MDKVDQVREVGKERDRSSGLLVHYLEVEDLDELPAPEERQHVQAVIEYWDQALRNHPEWEAPRRDSSTGDMLLANDVSRQLYGPDNPALLEWAKTMKTAKALYPLQRPHSQRLPGTTSPDGPLLTGTIIDDHSRLFLLHGLDSIGIRTRAAVMTQIVRSHYLPGSANRWVSLACGSAVPVLDALQDLGPAPDIRLDLIDWDPDALAFADRLAAAQGLVRGRQYQLHRRNLVRELVVSDRLVRAIGEKCAHIVDMMGIFEYFGHQQAVQMLANAYRLVDEGGVLIAANMLSSRPQLAFNQRGVGWPDIYPRTLEDIATIIQDAGIPNDKADVHVPRDGIYAVLELRK